MAGSTIMEKNLDPATVVAGLIFIFTTMLLAIRLQKAAAAVRGAATRPSLEGF